MTKFLRGVLLIAAFAVPLVTNTVLAQSVWEVGVKGAVNGSNLTGDQLSLFLGDQNTNLAGAIGDTKTGWGIGGYVRRDMKEYFALQVETWFTRKGGQGNVFGTITIDDPNSPVQSGDINGLAEIYLDYIEVPVLAIFQFPADAGDNVTLNAQLGGYIAFNTLSELHLSGEARLPQSSGGAQIVTFDQRASIKTRVNPVDIGGIVGGGLEIETGRVKLVFDIRYEFGLTSIDDTGQDRTIRNQTFSFTGGVGFPLGE